MNKIVFLDRDGAINEYPGHFKYVDSLEGFKFIKGSKEAIAQLSNSGHTIFVVSNQAGVTKGLYSKKTLDDITDFMLNEVRKAGGKIEKVLYCIHTDDQKCDCRKPKNGLVMQAIEGIDIDKLKGSFFVGDSIRDVKTGKSSGCKTILVLSGREKIENKDNWEVQPDFIVENLSEAAVVILSQNKN